MSHYSNTLTDQDIERWSDSHECDERVTRAIAFHAGSAEEMERLFSASAPGELIAIAEAATNNGMYDAADMQWGDDTLQAYLDELAARD
jgi:hypothetical protein